MGAAESSVSRRRSWWPESRGTWGADPGHTEAIRATLNGPQGLWRMGPRRGPGHRTCGLGTSNGLGDASSEYFLLTQLFPPHPSVAVAFKPHHRGGGLWGCWGDGLRERKSPWVATGLAGQTGECHCQHVTRIQDRVRLGEKWGRVEGCPGPSLPAPGITHAAQSLQAPGDPLFDGSEMESVGDSSGPRVGGVSGSKESPLCPKFCSWRKDENGWPQHRGGTH